MNLPNPEKIFFISDTHFGHRGIIEMCKRPFSSVEEMDETMIQTWNATVPDDGVVFHLGDVSFQKKNHTYHTISRLRGRKILIKGNHDYKHLNAEIKTLFEEVHDYDEVKIEGNRIILCHFPFESWNSMHRGSWHFHGHSHGNMQAFGKRVDVGVDAIKEFGPMSYVRLRAKMELLPIETRDHHKPKEEDM